MHGECASRGLPHLAALPSSPAMRSKTRRIARSSSGRPLWRDDSVHIASPCCLPIRSPSALRKLAATIPHLPPIRTSHRPPRSLDEGNSFHLHPRHSPFLHPIRVTRPPRPACHLDAAWHVSRVQPFLPPPPCPMKTVAAELHEAAPDGSRVGDCARNAARSADQPFAHMPSGAGSHERD